MSKSSHLYIDHASLVHNVKIVKYFAPHSKILAMIKANAFGHGMTDVAQTLQPYVDALGVARYDEAIELVESGISSKIVLMSGDIRIAQLNELVRRGCHIVISSIYQFEKLISSNTTGKTTIWLKINTGMNRLGIFLKDADYVIKTFLQQKWVENIILMTHLSDADGEKNNRKTQLQGEAITKLAFKYSLPISIANSAAIINYPQFHYDWVRPGIMIYGASPFSNTLASDYNLKATMELNSFLLDIRKQQRGDQIGYGSTWRCPEKMLLGSIPVGYGDGYPRNIAKGTPVWINGVFCPIVGRVSMDLITVDLRPLKKVKIGDFVQLWGRYIPIDIIAKYANTIPNELLTHISPRLLPRCQNREYKDERKKLRSQTLLPA